MTQTRVGNFVQTGPNMQYWPACTLGGQYSISTGIVHNQLLSNTSIYNGLVWKSPAILYGNISFIGAGVTDNGYGPFEVTYLI
jgi:hypothetical protein